MGWVGARTTIAGHSMVPAWPDAVRVVNARYERQGDVEDPSRTGRPGAVVIHDSAVGFCRLMQRGGLDGGSGVPALAPRGPAAAFLSASGVEPPVCALIHPIERLLWSFTLSRTRRTFWIRGLLQRLMIELSAMSSSQYWLSVSEW